MAGILLLPFAAIHSFSPARRNVGVGLVGSLLCLPLYNCFHEFGSIQSSVQGEYSVYGKAILLGLANTTMFRTLTAVVCARRLLMLGARKAEVRKAMNPVTAA